MHVPVDVEPMTLVLLVPVFNPLGSSPIVDVRSRQTLDQSAPKLSCSLCFADRRLHHHLTAACMVLSTTTLPWIYYDSV